MAYSVTALVRRCRLPATMRCRPLAKLVLLSLADRCDDDGRGAWPSLATIAAESEVEGGRTIATRLRDLAAVGLIVEQAPPRQHKPRTWALNLDALDRLAQPLTDLDPQPDAPLTPPAERSDPQPVAPLAPTADRSDLQIEAPDLQFRTSDLQPVAPDPVLLDPVHLNNRAREPKTAVELAGAREVLRELVAQSPDRSAWTAVLEQAGRECQARGIDLGHPDDHVLERAYVIEHMRLTLARVPSPRRSRPLLESRR